MATSSRKSSGPVLRSLSPSGKFYSPSFASSTSSFSPKPAFFRSTSPTRVNLFTPSLRFSSPTRSISSSTRNNQVIRKPSGPGTGTHPLTAKKRTCMCSPTTHPGSFRCSLHKDLNTNPSTNSYPSNRLNARRSAMTNSLVRIGTVEGDLVKRALAALIRPSSHQQRRRCSFQPKPSRLSVMTKAEES